MHAGCKTVTAAGQLRDARCRFVADDGGERLEVETTDEQGGAATTAFAVVDGYLAPPAIAPPIVLFERRR